MTNLKKFIVPSAQLILGLLIFNSQSSFSNEAPRKSNAPVDRSDLTARDEVIRNEVVRSEVELRRHGIGLGVGQTFLTGKFAKNGEDKITTDFYYSYSASYSFDLLIGAHASHHEYQKSQVWLKGYTFSIKGRSYDFDAFSPYILGGVGFYTPQIKNSEGITSKLKSTFGINFGLGTDLRLNEHIVIGLLAHYHYPFDIKQEVTDDVSGAYLKLLLTVMYLF